MVAEPVMRCLMNSQNSETVTDNPRYTHGASLPLTKDRLVWTDISFSREGMEKEKLVSLRPTAKKSAGEEVAGNLGDLVGQGEYLDREKCFSCEDLLHGWALAYCNDQRKSP